ncbi:MAG: hypothetical protein ALECFALPRED_000064 [Alectoria fallacina]|uniref:Uncharacterized protein n=1 Tax=Alectoria fallacina TaxID=1903189 RepID=A0A8H3I0W7_9LECA|nr:MAG: hypothetical protein ALECFALPRED_000064 [Alectoria fallacina]
MAFVYINGYPGVGKLTVANELTHRSLALSEATTSAPHITYIFTDSQSSSDIGLATAQEYETSAKKRRCPFVSIILSCHLEENMRRLQAVGRGESTDTKLTDLDIFRSIRETEDVYHFGGPMELELEVTETSAAATAEKIHAFIRESLPSQDLKFT